MVLKKINGIFAQNFQERQMHSTNNSKMLLPELLRKYREESELPQRKVAAFLDIDTATYCKIENGKYSPSKDQIEKIAEILNCDVKELIKNWLADKIVQILEENRDVALEALQLANKSVEDFNNAKDF